MRGRKVMEKAKFFLSKTLKRMLKEVWKENKSLFGRSALYMIIAGIYPFFAVVLPKFIIGVLEKKKVTTTEGIEQVIWISVIFFVLAGSFSFLQNYIHDRDYNKVCRLRISCLSQTFTKLMTME